MTTPPQARPRPRADSALPAHLAVPPEALGRGTPVIVRILGDATSVARDMARAMRREILDAQAAGREATLIVPVGPVEPLAMLADLINRDRIGCRGVAFVTMGEYLTDDDRYIPRDHPLSLRGFMDREFYAHLRPSLAPAPRNRVFPDPRDPDAIGRFLADRGGVDACFGGIGITGHIAFNEPPEPGERMSVATLAALPTRVLTLARETRAIHSVTVGGEIAVIPRRAVTVGMKECLGARRIRLYCNQPWQSAVVRRALHGPVSADCPASLI
ncbi:MAG: glucosamine-6-phosphate isomerase, partial [Lentisphaerae bacterium]|nr:glucosamine-6-phosphate isomerase [Lentisphaerota bacterium]